MWWLLASCAGDDDPPFRTPPAEDEPCASDPDNVLRVVCSWTRAETGPVAVRIGAGGNVRVFDGPEDELDVRIVAWDLLADTAYDWELLEDGEVVAEGTLRTRPLPPDVDIRLDVTVDGATSVDRLLLPAACGVEGHLVVLDALARVRWYQPTGTANMLTALDASDRGTVLTLMGREGVREWAFDGSLASDATYPDGGLGRYVHHAVVARHGRTFVLDTAAVQYRDGNDYLMDGVTVVGEGHVWGLDEVLDPTGFEPPDLPTYWGPFFPDAVDFAHENGLFVEDDGGWLLTFKHLDTVARVEPDGEIAWAVTGGPGPSPWPAVALALGGEGEVAFEYPHTPSRSPWGTVLLMDNGLPGTTSRVLELEVDAAAGTATIVRAWDLGVGCPVQSSVVGLPDGTVLAACTRTRELFELDDGGIRRHAMVSCPGGEPSGNLARAVPIEL